MAMGNIGSNKGPSKPTVYVRLGHGEGVGFIQNMGDSGKITHQDVAGRVAAFYVREEVAFEAAKAMRSKGQDPNKVDLATLESSDKQFVGALRLRDDNPAEPDVVVNFRLDDSLGGKIVGILHAQLLDGQLKKGAENNPMLAFSTFYRPPHSKYNDSDKGKDSLNAWPLDLPKSKESYITPVYLNAAGDDILRYGDEHPQKGEIAGLPMGEKVVVGKQVIWDHSARDEIILSTAVAVTAVFAKQAEEDTQSEQDGVDMNEAAAAAHTPA